MDRLLCCCVTTDDPSSEQVALPGEQLGVTSTSDDTPKAEKPVIAIMMESDDSFQNGQDHTGEKIGTSGERLIQQGRYARPTPRTSGRDQAVGVLPGGMVQTARSDASVNSASMTLEEKEKEKARLQRLVKDFAKEAVTGIAVSLVNAETARKSPHFFQMDRYLTVFSLKPRDGSVAEAAVQDFNVKDLTAIYKGVEVQVKAPSLGSSASTCVGLDTNRADRTLFFHFDDCYERDKFYTCLKILRMSVDISRPVP